jgi:hypothetical protein
MSHQHPEMYMFLNVTLYSINIYIYYTWIFKTNLVAYVNNFCLKKGK